MALPEVLRRDLSRVIHWEILVLAVEVETSLEKNIAGESGRGITLSTEGKEEVTCLVPKNHKWAAGKKGAQDGVLIRY